ncbi:hypothetical protein FNV43_RR09533 [Rhamnella rubrinervis]|uniref:Uncharacterized protein n=1 Tax=Rhamnella rubrinervis TaxID=2594499 RepID=A0A8K0MKG3_9ROSA|nr:hypothetical protein FNV43_RR09533 [Rhamnella rubrinervis]
MAPLKRLRKASDKSTKAIIVTEVATTKKRSREVEESSNTLQTANLGYSSVKYVKASAKLARVSSCYIRDTPRPNASRHWPRQLYNDDPHVIKFEFNGVGARFDRKAFVMITGLNCGKFPKESEMRNLSYNLRINLRSKMEVGKHMTSYSLYGFPLAFKYIVNNELIPREESERDLHDQLLGKARRQIICRAASCTCISPSSAAPEPESEQEPVYATRASTQSQPEGAFSQHLEGMINELREDFANIRANFGLQLAQ